MAPQDIYKREIGGRVATEATSTIDCAVSLGDDCIETFGDGGPKLAVEGWFALRT